MKRIFTTIFLFFLAMWAAYSQNVGIGTTSPAAILDVNSPGLLTTRFNGPNQMYLGFFETNIQRGYLGSFSGAAEDFDIGTSAGNTAGKLHLTTLATPKLTIDNTGNVGIGTTSPSALLDISSTTKGILIPRMTSAQRTAITTPVAGLMVYDSTTNSFWYYNGSTWLNMSGGGSFSLPYAANVNIASPVFQIENSGNGDVLFIGNLGSGGGLNTYTIGGDAINANSVNGYGVRTTSSNSYPLLALSDNAANILAAIRAINIGGGAGLHASSITDNGVFSTTSAATKAGVAGNNTGGGDGIAGTSNTGFGIKGVTSTTSSSFAGVYGLNTGTQGSGVLGIANFASGFGVSGSSTSGIGVNGYSNSYRGVSGSTINGSALYGNSISGYALEAVGNIKISGGNTNPAAGAVLTSDAVGNATWQLAAAPDPKIGFRCYGVSSASFSGLPNNEFANGTYRKVEFQTESYDTNGDFIPTEAGAPTSTSSTFLAPVRGVYHFDAMVTAENNGVFNHIQEFIQLKMLRNGTASTIAEFKATPDVILGESVSISMDIFLEVNDRIWVEYKESNLSQTATLLETSGIKSFFSGHLVYSN